MDNILINPQPEEVVNDAPKPEEVVNDAPMQNDSLEAEKSPLPEGYSFEAEEAEKSPLPEGYSFEAEEAEKDALPEGYSFEAEDVEKDALPEGYSFDGEEPEEKSDYSDILNIPRHVKRLGARALETVGEVTKGTVNLAAKGIDIGLGAARKLALQAGRDDPYFQSKEDLPLTGEGSINIAESIVKPATDLISGENIRSWITDPLVGKLDNTPQNKLEAIGDEIAKTVAALTMPDILGKGVALKSAVKVAGFGEGAKELYKAGAKEIGFNEQAGEPIKLGAMLLTSVLSGKPSTDFDKLYSEADLALKEGKNLIPNTTFKPIINSAKKLLAKKSGLTDSQKLNVNGMLKNIKTSKNAQEVVKLKKYVNTLWKGSEKPLKDMITEVSTTSKDSLLKWGKNANPKFVKNYFPAEELFIADRTFDKARTLLEKATKSIKNVNPGLIFMLGLPAGPVVAAKLAAGKYTIKKGIELTNYWARSPIFRAQYKKLAGEIAKGTIKLSTVSDVNETLNEFDEARASAESLKETKEGN